MKLLESENSVKNPNNSRNKLITHINLNHINQLHNLNTLNSSINTTSRIKSINFDNITTTSSRQYHNSIQNEYQIKPFEEHSQELKQLMNKYRIDTNSDLNPTMNTSILPKEDSSGLSSSMIKIHLEKTDYKNLNEAKQQILSNKLIHDEVSTKNYLRQRKFFLDKLKNLGEVIPNIYIKITNTYPKNKDFLTNSGGQTEINKINNISLNVFSNGIADMYGYYIYCNKSFPESREQFSICGDFFNSYIFGGYSTKLFNDIWELDSSKLIFNKINSDSVGPNPRFGHTSTLFNKKIYFYGGKIKTNNFSYLADLDIYCLEKQWSVPFVSTKNYFKLRKNHIAELIGNQIFFHGGFDEENQVLSDCFILNILPNLKFTKVSVSNKYTSPPLAGHSSCFVIGNEIKSSPKLNIYSFPSERGFKSKGRRIKEKGLYVFGGKNEKGILSNDMWIVKIGQKPIDWIKAETNGKKPCGRYLHSMNYYEEGNYIIIYGGKNDINNDIIVFNDLFLLELTRFEWIEIKVFSDSPISIYRRCGHITLIAGHKLIIFGGMNNENYIGSSLFIVCLDYCYNYSNDNKIINDDEKFKKLYMSECSDNKKKHKNIPKKQFFQNSNYYLPPIK